MPVILFHQDLSSEAQAKFWDEVLKCFQEMLQ
jgi:hypothetical protein